MAITLDAPVSDLPTAVAGDEEAAVHATELLESDDEGVAEVAEGNEPDPIIKIRLRKPINDDVQKFAALKGETFDGHVDADGDIYIQHGEFRIYMEAGDCESVEDEPEVTKDKPAAAETETKPPVIETTAICLTMPTTSVLAMPSPADDPSNAAPEIPAAVDGQGTPTNSAAAAVVDPPAAYPPARPVDLVPAQPPKAKTPFELYQDARRDIERHMGELSLRVAELKREATSTKKAHEVATDELQELIESWQSGKFEAGLKASAKGDEPKQTGAPLEVATPADATTSATPARSWQSSQM